MTALELIPRAGNFGRMDWIVGGNGLFLSHKEDGDELWQSHQPYGVNDKLHKFPAGYTPTLEDINEALGGR